jgi:hypothetical protein
MWEMMAVTEEVLATKVVMLPLALPATIWYACAGVFLGIQYHNLSDIESSKNTQK